MLSLTVGIISYLEQFVKNFFRFFIFYFLVSFKHLPLFTLEIISHLKSFVKNFFEFSDFLFRFHFVYQLFISFSDYGYYIGFYIKCQYLFQNILNIFYYILLPFISIISFNVLGVQFNKTAPTLYATAGGQSVYPFIVLSLKKSFT